MYCNSSKIIVVYFETTKVWLTKITPYIVLKYMNITIPYVYQHYSYKVMFLKKRSSKQGLCSTQKVTECCLLLMQNKQASFFSPSTTGTIEHMQTNIRTQQHCIGYSWSNTLNCTVQITTRSGAVTTRMEQLYPIVA